MKTLLLYGLTFLCFTSLCGQASFTSNISSGCGPLNVQFSDKSTGAISWQWDFGNGNQSALQHPSAIYINSGYYTVSLTIKDNTGNSYTSVKNQFIHVFEDPKAYFTASKRKVCPGDTLTFINQSTEGDAPIKTFEWNFGDGNGSSVENPVHSFATPGYRNITLWVTDNNGCISTKKYTSYIQIRVPPVADFTQDSGLSCKRSTKIQFTSTVFPGGMAHLWSFGDGNISTAVNPLNTYLNYGKYTVSLKVTDANGCVGIKAVRDAVIVDSVVINFSAEKPSVCDTISVVKFTNLSNVSIGYLWKWEFGDGATENNYFSEHQYADFGAYSVVLRLTGPGCVVAIKKNNFIRVLRNPPLKITVNDTGACQIPFQILFNSNTSSSATVSWDYGDMKTGYGRTTGHTYSADDTFRVFATATESNGCSVTDSAITFMNILRTYTTGELEGCVPFELKLKSLVYETSAPLVRELWYLGGTLIDSGSQIRKNLNDTGIYKLRYFGLNSKGCADTPTYKILVGLRSYPSFRISRKSICLNDTVFCSNTTYDPKKNLTFTWFNSEGEKTNTRDFITSYHNSQGPVAITLISENNGCKDTFNLKDSVVVLTPKTGLSIPRLGCDLPAVIPLVNTTTSWTSFRWTAEPKEVQKNSDTMWLLPDSINTYKINLFARNDTTGCEDSFRYDIKLRSNKPIARMSGEIKDTCLPAKITLTDKGSSGTKIFWQLPEDTGDLFTGKFNYFISSFGTYSFKRIAVFSNNIQECYDTAVYKVTIPKPDVSFSVSTLKSCTPATITLTDSGYMAGRKAWWKIGDSVVFSTGNTTNFTIRTPSPPEGTKIVFTAYDSLNRCYDSAVKHISITGPEAAINHQFQYNCKSTRIQLSFTKISIPGIEKISWVIKDTVRSVTETALYTVNTVQWVKVFLYLTDSAGCTSTIEKNIYTRVYKPQIHIGSDIKGAVCPPVTIKFFDSTYSFSNPVETWEWQFGDGSVSTLKNPAHTYLNPGKYTVTLKVKNFVGCFATDSFPAYITVNGPVGSIIKPPDSMCVPWTATFQTTAKKLRDVLWDFGDGTEGNGIKGQHIYQTPGRYSISAIMEDSAGCKTGIAAPFILHGLSTPKAMITQTAYCISAPLTFRDQSQYNGAPSLNSWKTDTKTGTGSTFTYTALQDKKDTLLFIALGLNGCNDTLHYNPVKSAVKPAFISSRDTLCLGDTILFRDISTSDTTIISRKWIWQKKTSDSVSPVFISNKTGYDDVFLKITNSFGCSDTIRSVNRTITGDTVPPLSGGLHLITVLPDHRLQFHIRSYSGLDWRSYKIYNASDLTVPVAASYNRTDTVINLPGFDVQNKSYCFGVLNTNLCHKESDRIKIQLHCQIDLKTRPDTNCVRINWNPYYGRIPDQYYLFRSEDGGPEKLIATTNNLTHYSTDRDVVCNKKYSYRLNASFPGFVQRSSSDTSRAIPFFVNKLQKPTITVAGVLNNEANELNIDSGINDKIATAWKIERKIGNGPFDSAYTLLSGDYKYWKDTLSHPESTRYYYRVLAMDECYFKSPYSNICSPILLTAGLDNDQIRIHWSPYSFWPGGVMHYDVEVMNEDRSFNRITTTTDTSLLSDYPGNRCGDLPVFRVTAVSRPNPGFSDSNRIYYSHSNFGAVNPGSGIFVPNAFTPNGNGLNEIFKPEVSWVKTYKLLVYDRWGSKIHESEGCNTYWDGFINGEPATGGCYAYRLELTATNGSRTYRSGTVLVLK